MKVKFLAVLFCAAAGYVFSGSAFALEILDCDGRLRAASTLGKDHSAQVVIIPSASDESITFSLKEESQTLSNEAAAKNGRVVFENVLDGKWTACPVGNEDAAIEAVMINKSTNTAFGAREGGVTLAALGGATLLGFGISESNSGGSGSGRGGEGGALSPDVNDPAPAPAVDAETVDFQGQDFSDFPLGAPGNPLSPYN